MGHFSTISSKGQLTIPQEIRKRLGLETGDRVEFVVEEGRTVIRPARQEINPCGSSSEFWDRFQEGKKASKPGLMTFEAIKITNENGC